jgi:cyclic-di-GMP-binding protein
MVPLGRGRRWISSAGIQGLGVIGMPSFDVVSEIDKHELANAVDQASRELAQRFDFKGTNSQFSLEETTVTMSAPADFQLKQMLDILKLKIAKRGIDIACLDIKDPEVNLATAKQLIVLRHGIDQEVGKKIQRLIKDSKLKVQAQIQGDKLRITGKQRDDLQSAIALLRAGKLELPLQFNNFRD